MKNKFIIKNFGYASINSDLFSYTMAYGGKKPGSHHYGDQRIKLNVGHKQNPTYWDVPSLIQIK